MVEVGSAVAYLELDTTRFKTGIAGAQSILANFNRNGTSAMNGFSNSVGKSLTNVGNSIADTGKSLTKKVTVPLALLGTTALKVSTDFEAEMSNVKAISGATGDEFKELRNTAIDLGASTAYSASEVAAGMTEMAKAGWSTSQIIDGMSGVLAAAASSGEGLATVSTIVADAITGFGLKAKDATRVADLLAQAANSGTIDIVDLGESFKYIAPVASAMNLSIEDVTTALSAMSMAGIKGSQAGTSLRTLLTNLVKPSEDAAVAMDKYNISATNSDGTMKSLNEIVANLRESTEGLTEAEKTKLAATLAGKTGMSGMLSLINLSQTEYDKLSESMNNCSGVAEKTAATMQDNLKSRVEQLGGALESLAIKLSDYVIPWLTQFVEKITTVVDNFTNLDASTQQTILKIAGIAAVIPLALTAFGKLVSIVGTTFQAFSMVKGAMSAITGVVPMVSSSVSNLIVGFKASKDAIELSKAGLTAFSAEAKASAMAASPLGAAIGGITAPVLAVVAAIAALVAAFVYLWKTNEDFRNNVTGLWNELVGKFSEFFQGITERLNQLGFNFKDISEVIMAAWDALCNFIAPVMEGALRSVVNTVSTCLDIIMSVVDIFIGLFTGNWEQCLNGFKSLFTTIWNYIVNTLKNILNTMKGVLDVALSWFGTSWKECWNSIVNFFKSIPSKVSSILSNMVSSAKALLNDMVAKGKESGSNFVNGIVNFVKNLPYNMGNLLGLALGKVISFAVSMGSKAKELGSNFLNSVITSIKNLPSNLATLFNTAVSKATSFASSMKEKATNAGSKFLTNLINGIKNLPSRTKELLDSTIAKVASFVTSMGTKGVNAASQFKSSITEGLSSLPSKMAEIGKNIATGLWNGIVGMKDTIINNVKNFGNGIIDGLKSSLDIHSPSRRAKKEVGEMFAQGVIEGVKAKKGAAKKTSEELSNEIIKSAKTKMDRLKAYNKVSLQDEIDYWAKIEKACKNGSKAETEAHKKWVKAKKALNKQVKEDNAKVLSNAEKYWDKQTTYHTKSAEQEAKYWKGILKKLKKGSDEYLQAYKNYISAKDNIDSERLSNAEKTYDRKTILNDMSAKNEAEYWSKVMKTLTKGSDEYYEAYKKYVDAKNSIDSERLSEEEQYLEDTKLYHDVSLKAEMDYWAQLRATYKEGTEERKQADKNYFDAKEAYQNKLLELEENYSSEVRRINEELNETVEGLYEEYESALQSRVDSIMSTFKLFEEYTFDEADGNAQDLINNLQSQVDAIETYGSELDKISSRGIVPEGMFEELKNLGVGATENLKVINSMTDEELIKYVSLWQQKSKEATSIAEEELAPMKEATEKAIKEAVDAASTELTQLKNTFDMQLKEINASSSQLSSKIGTDICTYLTDAIKNSSSGVMSTVSSLVNSVSSSLATVTSALASIKQASAEATSIASSVAGRATKSINGSHKNGLDRVPYDGYIAELHKGERVLTKEETDRMDSNKTSGDTFIFNSPTAIDEKEAARQLKRAKREMALAY